MGFGRNKPLVVEQISSDDDDNDNLDGGNYQHFDASEFEAELMQTSDTREVGHVHVDTIFYSRGGQRTAASGPP